MSDERVPVRSGYDAILDLGTSDARGFYAFALAKFTYMIGGGRCWPTDQVPLLQDMRNEELSPRMPADTDFWPFKPLTDFVVQGSAFPPNGRPVEGMTVAAQVGSVRKQVAVFGDREILWSANGRVAIGRPEPFAEMPLTYENAYGGIDFRVQTPAPGDPEAFMLDVDHPGLYPRNPFGKGYLVQGGEVPDMFMPNLEDPNDLLTPERLITGMPENWYLQPLPWCYDFVSPATFPRYIHLGLEVDAWHPGPEDECMPEVARGYLPRSYRSAFQDRDLSEGPHEAFFQAGSHALVLPLQGDEPVTLWGMHPDYPEISFKLPGHTPIFEFEMEGRYLPAPARLHQVVCFPNDIKITMVWAAHVPVSRPFLPGIHKHIPISVRINRDEPIHYEAPPTVKEELADAMKAREEE